MTRSGCEESTQTASPTQGAGLSFLRSKSVWQQTCNYHHSIRRVEVTLVLLFGFGVRSNKTGHDASFTTFSAIDPKTEGYQPERPCVEITT